MRKFPICSIFISMLALVLVQVRSDQSVMLAATAEMAGQEQAASADIRVQLGRSLVINSEAPLTRVSVTDPAIATAVIVSPTQVLIHGLKPGTVSLILWDNQDRTRPFNLIVELDLSGDRKSTRLNSSHRCIS